MFGVAAGVRACGVVVVALMFGGTSAQAATAVTLPCIPANELGDASDFSLGCEVLGSDNDNRKKGANDVATQAAFGIGDWVFAGKDEFGKREAGDANVGFKLGGGSGGQGGSWSVSAGMWDDWSSALVLFKSGSAKQARDIRSNGNVVMFLIRPHQVSGDYLASLGTTDVSHVSFYVSNIDRFADSEAPPEVPLPAAGGLLAGAAALLAALRLRRRRA